MNISVYGGKYIIPLYYIFAGIGDICTNILFYLANCE